MARQDPETFWRATPRLIEIVLAGAAERDRRDHNERVQQAWNTAFLPHAKPRPKFKDLLAKGPARRKRRQSPGEQMAIAKVISNAVSRKGQ